MINNFLKYKTSDRIYVLGSGRSVLDITLEEWEEINKHDSIGFNHWYAHEHQPTFYDLSYLANDYFEDKETDMFYLASKNCPNSKFILNHSLDKNHLDLFQDKIITKIHLNHFDFFDSDLELIKNKKDNEIGQVAKYWTLDFFNYFNHPYGELLPANEFVYKSRGQLFATIQIAVALGYKDIRLIGVDLNSEGKFQDFYKNAPYSSKSIGYGGENFKPRVDVKNNVKDPNGIHNTCQGTKDKNYLGIHKLLRIFNERCLKRIGCSLTVCNPNSLLVDENIKYQSIIENLPMEKFTFCIPSKSNVQYLKTCIPSIRNNAYRDDHNIIIFVDSDEDGTVEWLEQVKDKYNLKYYINPKLGKELYGIGRAYDFCIKKSTTDIFMIFHADMILASNADFEVYKHLKEKTVVCATRIEPPLHPNNGEKILRDFGMYPEEFNETAFNNEVQELKETHENDPGITEGIFAPWMMYKKEYLEILGGHDPILHSCREDSDVFNRMLLSGFEFIQTWEGFVYHFTGRGAGSFDGDEERHKFWQQQMNNSTKDFIRKWGQNINHTPMMKPIVYPKYNISFRVENCTPQLLEALEPWCDRIYVDLEEFVLYQMKEQPNTSFDLNKRIHSIVVNDDGTITDEDRYDYDDIIVEINGASFNQQDMQLLFQLPEILQDSGEIGEFELGNLKIIINSLKEYQNELINNNG